MDALNVSGAQLMTSAGNITLKTARAQPPVPPYVYDGSLLPSVPASRLQLLASWLYATFVFVVMGMGAFALSAQQKLDLDLRPHVFLHRLLQKRHALGLGILASIPATFSLVHLFTSSLHNYTIYNATNIVFAAVLSYGAKYLSEAMQQCMEESTHMDTCKAVYETLYMCANRAKRVLGCKSFPQLKQQNQLLADVKPTESDYTQQEVFAALALQDSRHYWAHFSRKGLWLFSQNKSVRTYTGSTVITHRIHQSLNTASFTAQQLYAHADGFTTVLASRMATLLLAMSSSSDLKAHIIQCGTMQLKLGLLLEALLKINFSRHALDIMCERYICRRTPAVTTEPGNRQLQDVLNSCAQQLFGTLVPAGLSEEDCCTVWLAYMHLVLLGVDLLRVHINQPVLAEQAASHGAYEAGFLAGIMGIDGMAEAAAAARDTAGTSAAHLPQIAGAAVQTASRRADAVQRYAALADWCKQAAANAAQLAQVKAAASQAAPGAALAAQYSQDAARAARTALTAANSAVFADTHATSAMTADIPPLVIIQHEAATLQDLAAVPAGVIAGPIGAAAHNAAAAAATDASRAAAAADHAHATSISAALEAESTRAAQQAIQRLPNCNATGSAAAKAAADELALAAGRSAATLLVYAAAAGNVEAAQAAAKTAAEGASSASITAAAAGMPAQDVNALRYEDIYCLTDMELCGVAAALATLLLAMEQPLFVNSAEAPASPHAAAAIAVALSQAAAVPGVGPPHPHAAAPAAGCSASNTTNMDHAGFFWKHPAGNARADAKVLRTRANLVKVNVSIPPSLSGLPCLSAADNMHSLQVCLAFVLMVMAFGSVAITTLVCRDGVTLASVAGMWQSCLVVLMFGLLHRVPRAPSKSLWERFWKCCFAPMSWMVSPIVSLLHCRRDKAWHTAQEGLRNPEDSQLKQVLVGSWLGAWCDAAGVLCLLLAFTGFLLCFVLARQYEHDCAPGALDSDAGPTKVYASSFVLDPTRSFVIA